MDQLGFSIGCRHCRDTDGKRWQLDYDDPDGSLPLANRGDFGLMRLVERLTLDLGHTCPFCQSAQLEIFDMDLNGQLVFNFEQLGERARTQGLAVCALQTGEGQGQPYLQLVVEPPTAPPGFLQLALAEMAAQVQERPDYDFAAERGGTFYFCVAGGWDEATAQGWVVGQKYTCRGLSREQALAAIASVSASLAAGANSAG